MHILVAHVLAASASTTTTKPTTSAASSVASLLFILVIGLAAYFLFLRPRSQAARRQRETLMEISAGDEVLTGAGIFGTVLDVQQDRVTIETAPGTRLTVLRSTIARRITPETVSDEGADHHGWDDEADHSWSDGHGDEEHGHDEGHAPGEHDDPDHGSGSGGEHG